LVAHLSVRTCLRAHITGSGSKIRTLRGVGLGLTPPGGEVTVLPFLARGFAGLFWWLTAAMLLVAGLSFGTFFWTDTRWLKSGFAFGLTLMCYPVAFLRGLTVPITRRPASPHSAFAILTGQ